MDETIAVLPKEIEIYEGYEIRSLKVKELPVIQNLIKAIGKDNKEIKDGLIGLIDKAPDILENFLKTFATDKASNIPDMQLEILLILIDKILKANQGVVTSFFTLIKNTTDMVEGMTVKKSE